MQHLIRMTWLSVICAVFSVAGLAQTDPKPAPPANPQYDAALAKRLGADERGMRSYVLVLLKTGPNDAKITEKAQRDELFKGHFAMIGRLADQGKLSLAGPFNDPAKVLRGLYVFNVATIEEAQKLTETDPSIKAGIFQVEFIKWYGSAALMEVNDIHKRISPQKP